MLSYYILVLVFFQPYRSNTALHQTLKRMLILQSAPMQRETDKICKNVDDRFISEFS